MEKIPELSKQEAELIVSLLGSVPYRIFVEKVLSWREINARNALLRADTDAHILERARRWQLFALALEDHRELLPIIERGLADAKKGDILTEEGLANVQTPWDVA